MAPLLYISVVLVTLLASCLAEIVSLRTSNNNQLAERNSPAYRFAPPFSSLPDDGDPTSDLELLDIVLVASVDGKFHALNRTSGRTLWSMSSSSALSAPSTLEPLVRTNHIETDPDLTDDNDDSVDQELYIIEPQSGDIYVMTHPDSPLQRLPFSMAQLVDMSPFVLGEEDNTRVFSGKKESSLLLIELETGKVKATLNAECPWDPFEDLSKNEEELDLDELEGSKPIPKSTEVYIGRTDYHITIHTRSSNPSTRKIPPQNLSFSAYGPNNQHNLLQSRYSRTKDDAYIQSLPNGEIISFKTRPNAGTANANSKGDLLWGQAFNHPIVATFDVVRKISSHDSHPFVLLQPSPRLQDVLPDLSAAAQLSYHPSFDSAYIGIVEETGSLFAMSPDRFPLVIFGGIEGSAGAPGRYIDPPIEVDEVTRARKEREALGTEADHNICRNGSPDRRCLTGVRRLEAGSRSRFSRLLDGVPFVPNKPEQVIGDDELVEEAVSNDIGQHLIDNSSIVSPLPWSAWVWDQNSSSARGAVAGRANAFWSLSAIGSFVIALLAGAVWIAFKKKAGGSEKSVVEVLNGIKLVEDVVHDTMQDTEDIPLDPVAEPPEPLKPPLTPKLKPSNSITNGDTSPEDGEDSEGEGEGDAPAVPGKRKVRRGKRGKKKKLSAIMVVEDGEKANAHIDEETAAGALGPEAKTPDPAAAPSSLVLPTTPKPESSSSLFVSETILGFGSHGTVVFQGSLQGRAVAVKRLLQDFVTLASREVSILQESDDHPNVIRYYYQEAHANFLYIALELCPASLADIIECPDKEQWRDIAISIVNDPKRALRQITSGLRHLHALKLVHRDIKPQNILISGPKGGKNGLANGKGGGHRMLISDFGLCKKLDVDQTSFLPTAHGALAAGTVGWRAPEILRGEVKLDETTAVGDDQSQSSRGSSVGTATGSSGTSTGKPTRLTKSVDIFALGCLFYYTLSNGSHPFGDRFEREVNILKNAKCLDGLEKFGEEGSEAADLINAMLSPEAYDRPDTTTCLLHPFFWDSGRRLNFLQDASDRFEIMCRDPKDANLLVLERGAVDIVGNDWHSRLDKIFIENLGKFRKYDGKSVQDLLRALRNKKHHYQDLPDNVKRHLGPMPEGFLSYFTRRFPRLFLHVHSVIASTGLRNESMFRSYFELPDS